MNVVPVQLYPTPASLRAAGPDGCSPLHVALEACSLRRMSSVKRKSPFNFTVLSFSGPEVSVVEQTSSSTGVDAKRGRSDGALVSSKGPPKGEQLSDTCLCNTIRYWPCSDGKLDLLQA